MSNDTGMLRGVSWLDCCPWFILFRTFRLALGIQILLLASLGVLLQATGWQLSRWLFVDASALPSANPMVYDVEYLSQWPNQRIDGFVPFAGDEVLVMPQGLRWPPSDPIRAVAYRFIEPIRQLFDFSLGWNGFAFYLFGSLWMLATWGFLGAVITRIAAVYLGREERIGLRAALKLAMQKWGSHIAAPILPLLGVAFLVLPMMVLGWLMRLDFGVFVAGIVWLLVLLGGFIMAVLLLGLLFGWPLMWPTIQTERSDAFDAISRAYAYTFQCPLRYLFYAVVAAAFGYLGWLLVWNASEAVISLSYWGTSWGAGTAQIREIRDDVSTTPLVLPPPPDTFDIPENIPVEEKGILWRGGTGLIFLAVGFVRTIAMAFAYSYFWSAAAAIYLLLRRDADSTELDEVELDDQEGTYGLPPLKTDEAGVPAVADEPSGEASQPAAPNEKEP